VKSVFSDFVWQHSEVTHFGTVRCRIHFLLLCKKYRNGQYLQKLSQNVYCHVSSWTTVYFGKAIMFLIEKEVFTTVLLDV